MSLETQLVKRSDYNLIFFWDASQGTGLGVYVSGVSVGVRVHSSLGDKGRLIVL